MLVVAGTISVYTRLCASMSIFSHDKRHYPPWTRTAVWILIVLILSSCLAIDGMTPSTGGRRFIPTLLQDEAAVISKAASNPTRKSSRLPVNNIWRLQPLTNPPVWNKNNSFFHILVVLDITIPDKWSDVYGPGVQSLEAARYSIQQINSDHTILPNHTLTYSIVDSQYSNNLAINPVLYHLALNDTILVVGPATSSQSYVVGTAIDDYNATMMSFDATATYLTNMFPKSLIRMVPDDSKMIQSMISIIKAMNWNLIVPIFSADTYGFFGRSVFIPAARAANIYTTCDKWVIENIQDPDNVPNITVNAAHSIAKCLVAAPVASVVLLFMDTATAVYVLSVLYSYPALKDLTFIATDAWYEFYDSPYEIQKYNTIPLSYLEGTLVILPDSGNVTGFKNYFSNLNPYNNPYHQFIRYWESRFRCIYVNDSVTTVAVVEKAGNESFKIKSLPISSFMPHATTDLPLCPGDGQNVSDRPWPPSCRCTGNESLSSVSFSYAPMYIYDCIWTLAAALDFILYPESGAKNFLLDEQDPVFQAIRSKDSIQGVDMEYVMGHANFRGMTGNIKFTESDRSEYSFIVAQTRKNGHTEIVGRCSNGGAVELYRDKISFKNCEPIIESSIKYAQVEFPAPLSWAICGICLVLICLSLISMLILHIHRRHPVVRKSSPLFCQLVLFGNIILLTGVILFGVKVSVTVCVLRGWFVTIGFGMIIANLLAKTYRILRIYSALDVPAHAVQDRQLLKFTMVIIALEIIILCIGTFGSGLPRPVVIVSQADPLYSYPTCETPNPDVGIAMTIVIVIFNGILVLLLGLVAYLTRNVASAYNESKYLAIATYGFIMVSVILVPLYFSQGDSTNSEESRYIVVSLCFILLSILTLLALILPKIAAIYDKSVTELIFCCCPGLFRRKKDWRRRSSAGLGGSSWSSKKHASSRIEELSTEQRLKKKFMSRGMWQQLDISTVEDAGMPYMRRDSRFTTAIQTEIEIITESQQEIRHPDSLVMNQSRSDRLESSTQSIWPWDDGSASGYSHEPLADDAEVNSLCCSTCSTQIEP